MKLLCQNVWIILFFFSIFHVESFLYSHIWLSTRNKPISLRTNHLLNLQSEFEDSLFTSDPFTNIDESTYPEYTIDYKNSFYRVQKQLGLNATLLLQHHQLRQQEQLSFTTEAAARTISTSTPSTSKLPLAASDLFCNRELNMESIQAVGFDMDYTLAQYKTEFDLLAYEGAKDKLISLFQYPLEIQSLKYESGLCRRGCILDTERGNILKLDQHRYPRVVEHGLTGMMKEERKEVYRESYQEFDTFNQDQFVNLDSPFSLVDAILYLQLVDFKDRLLAIYNQATALSSITSNTTLADSFPMTVLTQNVMNFMRKSYLKIWHELRKCIDRCHKDGVIKLTVAKNPGKYILYDPNLIPMLEKFKRYNKKVFLLTNSLWEYTQVVMNYLEGKKQGDQKDFKWMDYFDLIIVGGNKPAFMLDEGALSLYRINPINGTLQNIELLPTTYPETQLFLKEGKIFQGGNAHILHSLLQIPSGDTILYTGDHIYADVLRSKRSLGWRTCLIVPELTQEIQINQQLIQQREIILTKRKQQYLLENQSDQLFLEIIEKKKKTVEASSSLPSFSSISLTTGGMMVQSADEGKVEGGGGEGEKERQRAELEELEKSLISLKLEIHQLKLEIDELMLEYHYSFHRKWGQLFKARFQESRLAKQITDFACLYTSKASNLGFVSPQRTFRPSNDKMSHDHILEGL